MSDARQRAQWRQTAEIAAWIRNANLAHPHRDFMSGAELYRLLLGETTPRSERLRDVQKGDIRDLKDVFIHGRLPGRGRRPPAQGVPAVGRVPPAAGKEASQP